ncbi:MAG: phosphoribosylformimino-5-aminoimidazole carboxamide ribotide isomerase [Eubacteriales bacterium]|jgi:phosphoribosylformimino-5-aminoimidazole carboxamide ribotide isomerase
MEFRPCIDIHNGKVKQIVGGTLRDENNRAHENFVSEQDAPFYADMYRKYQLPNGHVILLNSVDSEYYEATKKQALAALREWPGGLEVGGGITPDNASEFLDAGASHVIVTSYVFCDGKIDRERLDRLVRAVGEKRLVLDLSCRKRDGRYYIVTDRWQKFTDTEVTADTLTELAGCCDEFLIHAADVEGKQRGVERELIRILADASEKIESEKKAADIFPITYAGGVGSFDDLEWIRQAGRGRINVTIGSALDIFGGSMSFEEVIRTIRR